MNPSTAIDDVFPDGLGRKRSGALWAADSSASDKVLPMPVAVGVATMLALSLVYELSAVRFGSPVADDPRITRVELLAPPAPPVLPAPPTPAPTKATPKATPIVKAAVPAPVMPVPASPQPITAAPLTPAAPSIVKADTVEPSGAPPMVASAKPVSGAAIGVVCPEQVKPVMPRQAIEDGTEGTVVARAVIRDGVVKDVAIVSGPRVFHAAVRAAMLQYRCESNSQAVTAEQSFEFKAAD